MAELRSIALATLAALAFTVLVLWLAGFEPDLTKLRAAFTR